jgi:hypothetical protein
MGHGAEKLRQHPVQRAGSDHAGNVDRLQIAWSFSVGVIVVRKRRR